MLTTDLSREGRLKALREGPYGRCVYHCDNDVVDRQVVNLEFDNGAVAGFTMTAFTTDMARQLKVCGTKGQITADMNANTCLLYTSMSLSAFRPFIWISNIWKEFGWDAIIYMAALTAIDPQLYEAASIDGANRLQKMLHITCLLYTSRCV